MDVLATIALCLIVGYGCLCGLVADDERAPRWLRWPAPIWNAIAHGSRKPRPSLQRPDYPKIKRLERELGLSDVPARELSPFEEGMKRAMERDL